MTEVDLNTLALGQDLTSLGLNLNSNECLYATFASPWGDPQASGRQVQPEYVLPSCYYANPPAFKPAHLPKFSVKTLMYLPIPLFPQYLSLPSVWGGTFLKRDLN